MQTYTKKNFKKTSKNMEDILIIFSIEKENYKSAECKLERRLELEGGNACKQTKRGYSARPVSTRGVSPWRRSFTFWDSRMQHNRYREECSSGHKTQLFENQNSRDEKTVHREELALLFTSSHSVRGIDAGITDCSQEGHFLVRLSSSFIFPSSRSAINSIKLALPFFS